ncbi:hypothetical protein BDF14DRAFT_1823215 [Spinellus fusiger]|nr:hypothetical protein BDF14DRAFT_1823215 [Spinellus fusiger]
MDYKSPLRDIYANSIEMPRRSPSERTVDGTPLGLLQHGQTLSQPTKIQSLLSKDARRPGTPPTTSPTTATTTTTTMMNAAVASEESASSEDILARLRYKLEDARKTQRRGAKELLSEREKTKRLMEEADILEEQLTFKETQLKDMEAMYDTFPGYLALKDQVQETAEEAAEDYTILEELANIIEELESSEEHESLQKKNDEIDRLMNCITECMYEIQVLKNASS